VTAAGTTATLLLLPSATLSSNSMSSDPLDSERSSGIGTARWAPAASAARWARALVLGEPTAAALEAEVEAADLPALDWGADDADAACLADGAPSVEAVLAALDLSPDAEAPAPPAEGAGAMRAERDEPDPSSNMPDGGAAA
jgi:hypothetical protein